LSFLKENFETTFWSAAEMMQSSMDREVFRKTDSRFCS